MKQRVSNRQNKKIDINLFIAGRGEEFKKIESEFNTKMKKAIALKQIKDEQSLKKARRKKNSKTHAKEKAKEKRTYAVYGSELYKVRKVIWSKRKAKEFERIIQSRTKID